MVVDPIIVLEKRIFLLLIFQFFSPLSYFTALFLVLLCFVYVGDTAVLNSLEPIIIDDD